MPKMKTHKGVAKRVRVTANGKVKHRRACTGHLMSSKSGDRRRRLRKAGMIASAFQNRLKKALCGAKP